MSETYDIEPPLEHELDPKPPLPETDYFNLQCKYCNRVGLHWEKDKKGRYYLATARGSKHTCKESSGFTKIPFTKSTKRKVKKNGT